MKALTIMQPYATLIMLGAKQYETRPSPPNGNMRPEGVRGLPGLKVEPGERIAIHAAARRVSPGPHPCGWNAYPMVAGDDYQILTGRGRKTQAMQFGALLGTVEVVRALPIVESWYIAEVPIAIELNSSGLHLIDDTDDRFDVTDVTDQIPYGDWQDGRWAWELANVERFDRPIPCKGKQGVWEVAA